MNRRDARISVIYHFKSVICGAAGAAPKDLRALVGNWPQIRSFTDQSACLPKPNTRKRIFSKFQCFGGAPFAVRNRTAFYSFFRK